MNKKLASWPIKDPIVDQSSNPTNGGISALVIELFQLQLKQYLSNRFSFESLLSSSSLNLHNIPSLSLLPQPTTGTFLLSIILLNDRPNGCPPFPQENC
ncbi:hypothetical protein CDAR_26511 [Caerostris darwini]|uniref:Uncharacterized protein n=1 Tax=Caerostris darwini TaxID=1538125 RepID=A0AAV4QHE1_9ARAC|nr:hypothetical protein CDAR_26511 [Caerostris darwini]